MRDAHLPPLDRPKRLQRAPPPGATDCHAHVFGPFDRFPLAADRHYTPPELPAERYLTMLDDLGFGRGVLVQPTGHGLDNRAMLNALDVGGGRLRGVAVVVPEVTDAELAEMDRRGVRGARFSRPFGDLSAGFVGFDALEAMAPRLARLGWHAQILTWCDHLMEQAPRLTALGLPLVIDHMALLDPGRGVPDPAFQRLLRLLDGGKVWLKLTAFRLSSRYPDYEDVAPFHRAQLAANPDRLLWGSDWPHVHMATDMPDTGHLVDLFDRWTGSDDLRRRILVDNPARLYGS